MTRALLAAVLLTVSTVVGCGDDEGGSNPRIDSLAPAQATVGATLDVLGVRFCGPDSAAVMDDDSCVELPNGFVTFGIEPGITRGQVVSWKGTRIQVKVPGSLAPGVTKVIVTVNGLASNPRDFTVVAP
jgi:hypothetical protein